jgi:hypothetical protein
MLLLAGCEGRPHPVTAQAPSASPSPRPAADLRALAPKASPPPLLLKGPHGTSCRTVADCPLTPNVPGPSSVTCNSNHDCQITQCVPQWYDADGIYMNGCECSDSRYARRCDTATELGTVRSGQSLSPIYGVLPAANEENWFRVTFDGNGKPVIAIASKSPQIVFDVHRGDCSGPIPCGNEGTSAANVTRWETGELPDMLPHKDPATPSTHIVRVYRNGGAPTCDLYTLTISNL